MILIEPLAFSWRVAAHPGAGSATSQAQGLIFAACARLAVMNWLSGELAAGDARHLYGNLAVLGFETLLPPRAGSERLPFSKSFAGELWRGWARVDLTRFTPRIKAAPEVEFDEKDFL